VFLAVGGLHHLSAGHGEILRAAGRLEGGLQIGGVLLIQSSQILSELACLRPGQQQVVGEHFLHGPGFVRRRCVFVEYGFQFRQCVSRRCGSGGGSDDDTRIIIE
jgi:hypothetical protein